MKDWVMNFDVKIGFEVLILTKMGFCEIPPPYSLGEGRRKKHVFDHNSAPNYLTKMKLHMVPLDFNTKKSFLAILEFSILRDGKAGTLSLT